MAGLSFGAMIMISDDVSNGAGRGPGGGHRGAAWAALLLCLVLALFGPATAAAAPYRLGGGYPVGDGRLRLGGYASVNLRDLRDDPARLEVSDLSLFLRWDGGGRWQAFSELEIGEALLLEEGRGLTTDEAEFELERAYVDYLHSERLNLRLGKFLTPIGHWNQVHADPLTWTVTRPLTTQAGFASHATGLMLYGEAPWLGAGWSYHLYVDDSARLDPRPDNPSPTGKDIPGVEIGAFEHARGLRLLYRSEVGGWQAGVSLARFGVDGFVGRKTLLGADFLWRRHGLELGGEALYRRDSADDGEDEWGGFLQGAFPLYRRWWLVARHELFDDLAVPGQASITSLGLTFRPVPPVALKLELRRGRDNELLAPDGLFASAAVLF